MKPGLTSAGAVAGALVLAALAAPASAQFGGLLGGSRSHSSGSDEHDKCAEHKRSTGSRIAGGILGSIAGSAAGRVGGLLTYVPVASLTDTLTASIACRLDPKEQEQAAGATVEATRGADENTAPEVGQMAMWTSETRDNVSGTSTVTASDQQVNDDGLQCIMVTDVVIVDGEEARAEKRMCRRPPAARYAIAA